MAVKFRSYHQNTLNLALHMVTTPAAVVAVLVVALQQLSLHAFGGLVAAYVLSLAPTLRSAWLWAATTTWVVGLVAIAAVLAPDFTLKQSGALFAFGYIVQELSHWITGEKTFQGSYMHMGNWPALLLEHTYFLLPLCLDALVNTPNSFAEWIVAHDYVVRAKLTSKEDRSALKAIYGRVQINAHKHHSPD